MVNGPGAGPVDRKEETEGVEEKDGRGNVPPRYVLPYLTWSDPTEFIDKRFIEAIYSIVC